MQRKQKEALVESLADTFGQMGVMVVVQQSGMTVAEMTSLRQRMRDAGASFKVTKNRLAKIAVADTPFAGLTDMFRGPTAVAFSIDPVAAAKVTVDYAKENDKLSIVGGALGAQILDEEGVRQLAKLPSLDEFRGRLVGLLRAPQTKMVSVLPQPATQVARVVGAPGAQLARVFQAFAQTGS